jgi:hypothetical protein
MWKQNFIKIQKISKKKKTERKENQIETLEIKKLLKSKKKTQLIATPAYWNKYKTELQNLKTKKIQW